MNWVFDRLLNVPANAKFLELGCGPAYLWKENISRIPAGWDITLSDLSSGMLDSAWRNLVILGRPFQFKEVDAQAIPFADETFDAVIANHMLYHVPDRAKAIGEIKRVLKPDGRLFATTIGQSHLKEIANWIRQVSPGTDFVSFGSPFTLENGLEQLKPFFSQVTQTRYPDSLQVTEIKPIIAFILSTSHAKEVLREKVTELENELGQELKSKGKIFIQKDSGLFEAIK
ncbi:MAG: class I SAM-dependent methyltransferase [Anaerolineales bacterium]|nr:class I SAM-dependent methyltransferase [Anaerolineales bacterium]